MATETQMKAMYTVVIAALVVVALAPQPGRRSVEYLDKWTAQSVITFGTAKTINAALSVVEDSELQLGGLTVAAGEVVRPLNDMIDRVASVALASAVSLGIQRLLVQIGGWSGFQAFLLISAVVWLIALWARPFKLGLQPLASRLLLIALVIRLLVPVAILGTGYLGDQFTAGTLAEAQQELEPLRTEATTVNVAKAASAASGDASWFEKISDLPSQIGNAVKQLRSSVSVLIESLATKADVYSEVAIKLIVVFIVQTMLMPLLLLWGLIKLARSLFGIVTPPDVEARLAATARGGARAGAKSTQAPEFATEARG